MTVRRTRLKKAAPASFVKYIKVRQYGFEDRLVERPYSERIVLPGMDPYSKHTGIYKGRKVRV